MSANLATSFPLSAPAAPRRNAPERPLRAVPASAARRARPKIAYAVGAVAGVLAIVVTQLLLSVGLSHGAYEISALTKQQTQLTWEKQAVTDDLLEVSSPQFIAANAQALGMVISGTPAYLQLSDGAIVGVPAAATTDSSVPVGASTLVANSLITDLPLVTVPDQTVDPANSGVADADAPVAPISLDNGIPSPQTH
jgi:hypothetical protein